MTKAKANIIKEELAALLEEKNRRVKTNKFENFYFQDHKIDENGLDVSREHYKAHLAFFEAGAEFNERAFIAANRVGKTIGGAYEMTCHLTGKYPTWWKGKKFDGPINAWAVGKNHETTRDVLQYELLGSFGDFGTGMIPKDLLVGKPSSKSGVPRAVQDIRVRHVSGGVSELGFKSYVQGIDSFMGTARHVIWHDEECRDESIYSECFTRTMTVKGIIFTTFTPLSGLSPIVLKFMPSGKIPKDGITRDSDGYRVGKFVVNCDWDSAPHLTENSKKELLRSFSAYERDARSRGIPALGAGAVYPVFEEDIVVEPFKIPSWYKRAYGMDFGWNKTAVVWGAQDPDTKIIYLYSEHYMGKVTFPIHAEAIKARGDWIVGACDPAGGGPLGDGVSTIQQYEILGLKLFPGNKNFKINAVEPGIARVLHLFESGQLKIFSTLHNTLDELRIYRRELDTNGELKIVKRDDHLMDAFRYMIFAWDRVADEYRDNEDTPDAEIKGQSDLTGY